jgi:predicted RNA binding protein with dsRBD fold (UPF0201 family)
MATVGNLFVNIGASSRGVEQATKKATAAVKSMKADIDGALSNVPGLDRALGPLNSLLGFFKKITGDSKGMAAQLKVITGLEGDLVKATDRAAEAQKKLAMAQKYAGMQAKRNAMDEPLNRATAAVNKHLEAVRSYEARINRANVRGAAYNSMIRKQEGNLRRLAGAEREMNRRRAESAASDKKLGMMRGLLQRGGVKVRADGGIDLDAIKAQAAGAGGAVGAIREKLSAARSALAQFGALSVTSAAGLAVLGGGIVAAGGAAVAFTLSMAKSASALYDQASALGVTVSSYQRLRDTFNELGVAPGVAEMAMQRLQAELQSAVEGSEDAQKKFARLGIDFQAMAQMDTASAFDAVLDRLRALGTQGEKIKSLRDLFGRQGVGMAAAVNATAEEIAHASSVAASLKLPDQLIGALDQTNDSAHAMFRAFENVGYVLAGELAPSVDILTVGIREMLTQNTEPLVSGFKSIAVFLAVIVDIVQVVGKILKFVWNIVQAIGGILLTVILAAVSEVQKGVGYIVKGIEYMTGATTGFGEALIEASKQTQEIMGATAQGVAEDLSEGVSVFTDGFNSATLKWLDGVEQKYGDTKQHIASEPIAIAVAVNEESLKKIEEKMKALRDRVATFNMTDTQKELYELKNLGAGADVMKEAEALGKQLEAMEAQKKAHEDIKSIMDDLQEQADTALMTEEQKLQYKLKQLNASEEELAKARALSAAIKERTELLKAQEASAQTLEDLREKVRKKQIGEDAFAREQFAKGASAAQLAEFDRLQKQLAALEDPTAVTETASTAFGSFKMAGDVKQNEMLKETTTQTGLLEAIAKNTQYWAGALS